MEGWIKIHRKMLEWEWFTDTNTAHLFLYLLLKANAEDRRFQGTEVLRGALITSYDHLAMATGMSVRSVRTALQHLTESGEVKIKPTSKFTHITICKYSIYQDKKKKGDKPTDKQPTSQLTDDRQATDKQPTTNEEINKEILSSNENNIYSEKKEGEKKEGLVLPPFVLEGLFLETFCEHHRKQFNTEYQPEWRNQTDDVAKISDAIVKKMAESNNNLQATEDNFRQFTMKLLQCFYNQADDFQRNHWSLHYIATHFNELYIKILNKKNGNTADKTEYIESLVASLQG